MNVMADIIRRIELGGAATMSAIIKDLIKDNEVRKSKMISNYERYRASDKPNGVPVFSRTFVDKSKVDNQINNAFDGDIIDVKTGYMLGNPIIYSLDNKTYSSKEVDEETGEEKDVVNTEKLEKDLEVITEFNKRNNIEDLDGETLKMASICAYGSRLLYISKDDGLSYVTPVEPWECIFVQDGSLNESQYAMRYYDIADGEKKKIFIEWYDDTYLSYYISENDMNNKQQLKDLTFIPYSKDGATSIPHMFAGVPLLKFENNKENLGDVEKVYALIDGYDASLSDVSSELEQFRLAYLIFYGLAPNKDTLDAAKKTSALGMPEGTKAEFVTKTIDDLVIEHHLDRIEKNIYRFGKSVNFSDESFAGTITGIAMKFKMFGLESKCIISERKFTTALRNMYKILGITWNAKGNPIDTNKMTYTWTRTFPLNLLDESLSTMNLKGQISEDTRLGLLSFIDDVEKEKQLIAQEQAETDKRMLDMEIPDIGDKGDDE